MDLKKSQTIIILNNIRSSENVGSIFRTCDAAGVSKIILCGYTPAPVDRFGRENKGLTKASLGAEKFLEWEREESLKVASEKLKEEGFKIVGVEQDKDAITYTKIRGREKLYNLAFVFGNETEGLSKKDLKLCDLVAEIPMRGKKESLNVAVAAGIILFNNHIR
ncbi:MAG TPA: TrmH family RNA methyltransferase [Candidatus Paceibacterota bacterium]